MPSFTTILGASILAFHATNSYAHMLMASPLAYGKPDKSPLDPSGSNFPCKSTSSAGAPVTNMAIGQQQILSFNGTAVHGGGSCQISLTTDTPATKNSKWMVIHSIEGGCPARNTAGNLPEGADPDTTKDPDTYKYTIPAGITPGAYTLAWTWFNKVGNREMYMNCAAIKVTGGTSKRDESQSDEYDDEQSFTNSMKIAERAASSSSFPTMFTANIGNGCATAEGGDLQFPNPGTSVEKNTGYIPKAPVGSCGTSSGSGGTSGSSSGSSSGNSSGSSPGSSPSSGGSSGSGASSGTASAAASAPATPQSSAAPAAPSVAGTGATTGNSSSGSGAAPPSSGATTGGASVSSCSTPGQSICSPDGTSVGTCDQSNKVTWVKVAQGTKCSSGNIVAAKRWVS